MFLIDMCSISENTVGKIEQLFRLILSFRTNNNIQMVFAMTSGLGIHFPSKYSHLRPYFSLIYTTQKCRMTVFKKSEARAYIKNFKEDCIMGFHSTKESTNLNPYFMSRIDMTANEHRNRGRVKAEVAGYFSELVNSLSIEDLRSWVLPEMEASQRWLYKASNGI